MVFTPFKWNFAARTFLQLFLSYDFKKRNIIAFYCCFLYFSFVGYLFFGHQCERFYNARNLTIDSILSRVKKQYYRVIKFFKTSYQLHFLFSWNVFWMLIKETKICWKFIHLYLFPQILQGPSGTFGLHMLRKKRATLISSMSECYNNYLEPFLTGVLHNDILPVMMLKYLVLGLCYDNNFYTVQWSMRGLFKYKSDQLEYIYINKFIIIIHLFKNSHYEPETKSMTRHGLFCNRCHRSEWNLG